MPNKIPVEKWVSDFLSKEEYKVPTALCATMTSFGSDKGNGWHNYTTLYSKLFSPLKDEDIHLFELGLGTNFTDVPSHMGAEGKPGASLYGWAAFFSKAQIYGADIDRRILFQDQRISTYYCDQCDPESIEALFSNEDLSNVFFDIIIDDGLHDFNANLNFLLKSFHKLKKNGIYIVEDLICSSREAFIEILPKLQVTLGFQYIDVIAIPSEWNRYDNALLIAQK